VSTIRTHGPAGPTHPNRRSRRRFPVILLILLTVALPLPLSGDLPAHSDPAVARLWSLALAATEGSDRWLPAESVVTMEFLGRNGETDETLKMLTRVTPTDDGLDIEMVEIQRPGGIIGAMMPSVDGGETDATSGASRAGNAEGDDSGGGGEIVANPFHPDVQASLWLRPAVGAPPDGAGSPPDATGAPSDGTGGDVPGPSVAFDLGWVGTDGTAYEGRIWLSPESGTPLRLDATGASPDSNVKALNTTVWYDRHEGVVLPVRSVTSMEYRYALVIRIRMRMTMEFSDYFDYGPME